MVHKTLSLSLLLLSLGSQAVWAIGIDLTPFASYRAGGEFTHVQLGERARLEPAGGGGVSGSIPLSDEWSVELGYARQQTYFTESGGAGGQRFGIGIDYYELGARYDFGEEPFLPFAAVGFMFTHFRPEVGEFSESSRPGLGFGMGGRYFFSDRWGVRVEGKGYLTFVDKRSRIYCDSRGNCEYGYAGDTFWQGAINVGAVISLD